jgi:trimethylamine:corrinoid methyltransferase-like protein
MDLMAPCRAVICRTSASGEVVLSGVEVITANQVVTAGVLNEGLIKPGAPVVIGWVEVVVGCRVSGWVNGDGAERALQSVRRPFGVPLRVFAQG